MGSPGLVIVWPLILGCGEIPGAFKFSVLEAAMDVVDISRWQFGITTVYHFIFVPLTLGMAPLVAIMQTMWALRRNLTGIARLVFLAIFYLLTLPWGLRLASFRSFNSE